MKEMKMTRLQRDNGPNAIPQAQVPGGQGLNPHGHNERKPGG